MSLKRNWLRWKIGTWIEKILRGTLPKRGRGKDKGKSSIPRGKGKEKAPKAAMFVPHTQYTWEWPGKTA